MQARVLLQRNGLYYNRYWSSLSGQDNHLTQIKALQLALHISNEYISTSEQPTTFIFYNIQNDAVNSQDMLPKTRLTKGGNQRSARQKHKRANHTKQNTNLQKLEHYNTKFPSIINY
ncbi:hypothetical protein C0J52_11079 [Blattella germanica]|nr:hypothetical protein C0J52_11079 [Blattella germanica]